MPTKETERDDLKICPLLSAGQGMKYCQRELCAWWYETMPAYNGDCQPPPACGFTRLVEAVRACAVKKWP